MAMTYGPVWANTSTSLLLVFTGVVRRKLGIVAVATGKNSVNS